MLIEKKFLHKKLMDGLTKEVHRESGSLPGYYIVTHEYWGTQFRFEVIGTTNQLVTDIEDIEILSLDCDKTKNK